VDDLGAPMSYLTLEPGTPVFARDGSKLGAVEHVMADENADIFDGLVLDTSVLPGGHRFADASKVDEIYERGVVLELDAAEAERLPEPTANPAVMEASPDDVEESDLERKLRQAWDRISGNY
jgi:uncharacterized protein YrrD